MREKFPLHRAGERVKGAILFRKREWPLWNPKRKTLIGSLRLEWPLCLRKVTACAALPRLELLYDLPLLLSSAAALESERKCSVITCCRWHNIAASAAKPPWQEKARLIKFKVDGDCVRVTNRRQSDSEDRSKPSRIATPPGRHPIRQAPQLFKLLACNVKTFLLGDQKGEVLFCEREPSPLSVPCAAQGTKSVS